MLREVQLCEENWSNSKNNFFQVYKEQGKKRLLIKHGTVISKTGAENIGSALKVTE